MVQEQLCQVAQVLAVLLLLATINLPASATDSRGMGVSAIRKHNARRAHTHQPFLCPRDWSLVAHAEAHNELQQSNSTIMVAAEIAYQTQSACSPGCPGLGSVLTCCCAVPIPHLKHADIVFPVDLITRRVPQLALAEMA